MAWARPSGRTVDMTGLRTRFMRSTAHDHGNRPSVYSRMKYPGASGRSAVGSNSTDGERSQQRVTMTDELAAPAPSLLRINAKMSLTSGRSDDVAIEEDEPERCNDRRRSTDHRRAASFLRGARTGPGEVPGRQHRLCRVLA